MRCDQYLLSGDENWPKMFEDECFESNGAPHYTWTMKLVVSLTVGEEENVKNPNFFHLVILQVYTPLFKVVAASIGS